MSATEDPFVSVTGVSKWYGAAQALDNVSVSIERGKILTVVGPSGSGKSTLLRCVNRIEDYRNGTILVDGVDMNGETRNGTFRPDSKLATCIKRRRIGMVFQRFNLFAHLNAQDNVALGLRKVLGMGKRQAREIAEVQLTRVKLQSHMHKRPHELSGGQQQRVGIARAIAMDPVLILFDEPTSALDPELVGEVLEVIRDLAKAGMTMMIVTHEMKFAHEISTNVALMEDGKVVEISDPTTFFSNPTQERTKKFLSHFTM
ncbi:MAG: amino acid ABC transporter ATP-binding protein [Devosia sp.]|nr:amino acid ABC transporter ATP-binding protein [Devosia sp.]